MDLRKMHAQGFSGDRDPTITRAELEILAVHEAVRATNAVLEKKEAAGQGIGSLSAAQILAIDQLVTSGAPFDPEVIAEQLT